MLTSKRIFYVMIVALVLLIAAIIGSTYVASVMLQKESSQLLDLKLKSSVLEEEQKGLVKAKRDIAKYSELEKIAKAIVPQDKDQAKAVLEIIKIAADSGIKPTAITFPASTLGNITAAPAGGTAVTPSQSAAASALSQLTPVKGIKGVYNLQITVQLDANNPVPYSRFIDFLSRLEQNRRTAQVTSIVLQPSPKDRNLVSFTITLDEFIKP